MDEGTLQLHMLHLHIDFNVLPAEEQDDAQRGRDGLLELITQQERFRVALALFDHASQLEVNIEKEWAERGYKQLRDIPKSDLAAKSLFFGWKLVACRDGALTIYNFAQAMKHAKGCLKRSPTLDPMIKWDIVREATDLFKKNFPSWYSVRQGAAHPAELTKNETEFQKNAFDGPFDDGVVNVEKGATDIMISDHLIGRKYSTTHRQKVHSYEVSAETLENLRAVIRHLFPAMNDIREGLRGRPFVHRMRPA